MLALFAPRTRESIIIQPAVGRGIFLLQVTVSATLTGVPSAGIIQLLEKTAGLRRSRNVQRPLIGLNIVSTAAIIPVIALLVRLRGMYTAAALFHYATDYGINGYYVVSSDDPSAYTVGSYIAFDKAPVQFCGEALQGWHTIGKEEERTAILPSTAAKAIGENPWSVHTQERRLPIFAAVGSYNWKANPGSEILHAAAAYDAVRPKLGSWQRLLFQSDLTNPGAFHIALRLSEERGTLFLGADERDPYRYAVKGPEAVVGRCFLP